MALNPMKEEVVFWDISRVNRTTDNHFSSHGSSVDDLNQILKVLLGFEAADKLGVIW